MEIRHDVDVARSPEAVFDFLTDTASFAVLDQALVSFDPPGRMRVGTGGTFVHRRSGFTARSTWEVRELDRPSRIHVTIHGAGYILDESATLARTSTGTHAAFLDTVQATSWPGRLMVALAGGIMRRDLERRAERLRAVLESADAASAPD
jgi:hypothetical protein